MFNFKKNKKNDSFNNRIKKLNVGKSTKNNFEPTTINKKKKYKEGSVLILLSLRFEGKKAILLKTTKDGYLVIIGPFYLSGISLRRIIHTYVVPTEICLNLSGLNLQIFNDRYFAAYKKTIKKIKKRKFCEKFWFLIWNHKFWTMKIDEYLKKEINQIFFLKYYLKTKAKISLNI